MLPPAQQQQQQQQQQLQAAQGALLFTKQPFKPPEVPRKIQQIRFGLHNPQEIIHCGVFNVYERALFKMPERTPHPNGVLDPRLGISSKSAMCRTCGQRLADCAGHFGYLKLELPVFHIGYFKNTVQLLQCICKTCSRVLLPELERRKWLKRFRSPRLERVPRELLFRKVIEACKRTKACHFCGAANGTVKKATGSLKIVHEVYAKNSGLADRLREELSVAMAHNEQLAQCVVRCADDLHPLRVLSLFRNIPDEDLDVLDIAGRPEDLLVTVLPVPPVCIRPSVEMDGASNEDDITMKLMQIIDVNNLLRELLQRGNPTPNLMENWDFLQVQAAMLINADLPGVTLSKDAPTRPMRGFVQRLKGKQGRFRGNLSGKRVDFSGRTVISPDPNLAINQVCVPLHMATVLTFPERVTEYSLAKLKQRVAAGPASHPGANFVVLSTDGARIWLRDEKIRRKLAAELKVGDTVERHLEEGDVVLFNRQPSLHRVSIQAFRAVVRPGRTLRFNECVCTPFNADFDGDEMNLHLPQTEEARAEAITLMGSVANLSTPKNGEILIAATQDFLTCAFLTTSRDKFLSRSQFSQLAAAMGDGLDEIDLPAPALLKPQELWTGKQLWSVLVRPNARTRIFLNLEMPEREYSKKGESLCPKDGWVVFRNSELLCGRLGKGVLGGNKGGIFGSLAADFSPAAAAACMTRLSKMSARVMGDIGFSIGIDDVMPREKLLAAKAATLEKGYASVQESIAAYKKGTLALQSGCNMEQTLEATVTGELNHIREAAGKVCMETLARHNSPLIMSQCGSKGSAINIAQMVACVGQQSVGGKRCFNGFKERTLPHFPRGDKTPAGRGFVANSFFSGLTPSEFFFHTMAGREGLVDTAVKTAETGYMSRRLMKALEDLYVHYDCTVRNAAGSIVQLAYGDDGLDPVLMEGKDGAPLDFHRLLAKVRATLSGARAAAAAAATAAAAEAAATGDADPAAAAAAALQASLAAAGFAASGSVGSSSSSSRALISAAGGQLVALPNDLAAAVEAVTNRPELLPADPTDNDVSGWCSIKFREEILKFLQEKVVDAYAGVRVALGLPRDARGSQQGAAVLEYVAGCVGLTQAELEAFVARCLDKYEAKRVDPGSTVGAVGAQSIGEPGTQMTLKTFHFAGVASMNVTLGVPRIKEIINGAKNISTPIMKVCLNDPEKEKEEAEKKEREKKAAAEAAAAAAGGKRGAAGRRGQGAAAAAAAAAVGKSDGTELTPEEEAAKKEKEALLQARLVKGRVERTTLGQVARDISLQFKPGHGLASLGDAHVLVRLNMETIGKLQLAIDAASVKYSILTTPKLKLKPDAVRVVTGDTLIVSPPDTSSTKLLFGLEQLIAALPKVIVMGIPTVERAVIQQVPKQPPGTYELLVEGTGLQAVMGTLGVVGRFTTTNHVAEMERVLGIEAARKKIMDEIKTTMGAHGMSIDERHTMLLADCMTYKGEVLGITRFGIAKMKDSVLHTASFEKTADHLFDAAIHGRIDDVVGVSESIIMGIPMPTGTGLFKLLQDVGPQDSWLGVAAGAAMAGAAGRVTAVGGVAGTQTAAMLGLGRPPPLLAYPAAS